MKNYSLDIAGYIIRIETSDGGPDLQPSPRFLKSIVSHNRYDLLLKVHSGHFSIPGNAEKVFFAQQAEDEKFVSGKTGDEFWSVYREGKERLFVKAAYSHPQENCTGILVFSPGSDIWDLRIEGCSGTADPLAYPIDGLLLYYLTVISGDIMIHASGVNCKGKGYIFSGISGKGKSTIASLWESAGAEVIHDDRLIIRRKKDGYTFFNTPVYESDEPKKSKLNAIYLLEHGRENEIMPVSGATAASLVLANCIQHNWNREIVADLLEVVSLMCERIPVFRLYFRPEKSIVDFILGHEQMQCTTW